MNYILKHLPGSGFSRLASLPFGPRGSLSITEGISHSRMTFSIFSYALSLANKVLLFFVLQITTLPTLSMLVLLLQSYFCFIQQLQRSEGTRRCPEYLTWKEDNKYLIIHGQLTSLSAKSFFVKSTALGLNCCVCLSGGARAAGKEGACCNFHRGGSRNLPVKVIHTTISGWMPASAPRGSACLHICNSCNPVAAHGAVLWTQCR